eukprot:SAG11_NODE_4013_length_2107_cov_90.408367_3_plen_92_part_00
MVLVLFRYFFTSIPGGRDLIFSGNSLTRQRDGEQGYARSQTCGIALPPGVRAAHRGLSAPLTALTFRLSLSQAARNRLACNLGPLRLSANP